MSDCVCTQLILSIVQATTFRYSVQSWLVLRPCRVGRSETNTQQKYDGISISNFGGIQFCSLLLFSTRILSAPHTTYTHKRLLLPTPLYVCVVRTTRHTRTTRRISKTIIPNRKKRKSGGHAEFSFTSVATRESHLILCDIIYTTLYMIFVGMHFRCRSSYPTRVYKNVQFSAATFKWPK
jgi:hypothetical protein